MYTKQQQIHIVKSIYFSLCLESKNQNLCNQNFLIILCCNYSLVFTQNDQIITLTTIFSSCKIVGNSHNLSLSYIYTIILACIILCKGNLWFIKYFVDQNIMSILRTYFKKKKLILTHEGILM